MIYQMLYGRNPFFDKKKSMSRHEIVECYKRTVSFSEEISPLAVDLISRMLVVDPQQRMDFPEFFAHPWLQDKPGCLSEWLRSETLKQEVARSLLKSTKPAVEKEFIMENCQTILTYTLIEFLRNYLENSLTTWLNLAKHLIDLGHHNARLTFLALAVILENVDQTMQTERRVVLNGGNAVTVPHYMKLREMQSWEMSEYTKRLPGFVAKSRLTINEHLQTLGRMAFSPEEGELPLWALYLNELKKDLRKESSGNMRLFLKVKSWEGPILMLNLSSTVLSSHALSILIRTATLQFHYNELCRKCSSIFRLSVDNKPSLL
jgi:serine/threonine protein kinase